VLSGGKPSSSCSRVRWSLLLPGVLCLVLASCATAPTPEAANDAVLLLRDHGSWAWALGIALIWGDLVLPIPQSVVITALGMTYGVVTGGLIGSLGLISGGLLGYGLMRTAPRRFVQRFVRPRSLQTMENLFERRGAWAIVLTRSVPTAFAFAAIGAGWADQPIAALAAGYVLPIVLLPIALYLMRLRAQ
jgi:uncharacterized membrane protein YdjX (TVP38/TMEM64 family)